MRKSSMIEKKGLKREGFHAWKSLLLKERSSKGGWVCGGLGVFWGVVFFDWGVVVFGGWVFWGVCFLGVGGGWFLFGWFWGVGGF